MKTPYVLAAELPRLKHLPHGKNFFLVCTFVQLDIQSLHISEPKHLAKLPDTKPQVVDEDHELCQGQLKLLSFPGLALE